jgi:peptide/nickel transport system permease protein
MASQDAAVVVPSTPKPFAAPAKRSLRERGAVVDVLVRLARDKPVGLVGGIIVVVLLIVGIFADLIAPYGFNEMILSDRLAPPSLYHIFGTDNTGRDLFSRIVYGARISMVVGLGGALLHVLVGFAVGATTGFSGGKADTLVQRLVDAIQCFPSLILYLTVMAVVGTGLLPVVLVLGISSGIYGSRTIRGAVIGIKHNTYVEAAAAIGSRSTRTLLKHILPNIGPILIIEFTLAVGRMITAEAMLSFLGFGVPPPAPSWGGMLSDSGRRYMLQAPWMALWPGLALAVVVYGVNMLGDALRDLWDPRLRGGVGRYGVNSTPIEKRA